MGKDTNIESRGGLIILMDVPPGTSISLDGITRVTPQSSIESSPCSLNNGIIWCIDHVPSSSSSSPGGSFHLLVVRCGSNINGSNSSLRSGDVRNSPVGFLLTSGESMKAGEYEWVFARKYDPLTEEISNKPLDELTERNLLSAIESLNANNGRGELGNCVMSYEQFIGANEGHGQSANEADCPNRNCDESASLTSWEARSSYIDLFFLQRRHSLTHGDKIVSSSCTDDSLLSTLPSPVSETMNRQRQQSTTLSRSSQDGKHAVYPPIPCVDPTINARKMTRHSGTRAYFSMLSPEQRTWLLCGASDEAEYASGNSPGSFVFKDVLTRYYDDEGENEGPIVIKKKNGGNFKINEKERHFLADIQFSFLLFLFLECQASLEHWRDAISMCSLSANPCTESSFSSSRRGDQMSSFVSQRPDFFLHLLVIIQNQLLCIETEFFEEVEYSAGESNFLVLALRRLFLACNKEGTHQTSDRKRAREEDANNVKENKTEDVRLAALKLKRMARDRFGVDLDPSSSTASEHNEEMEIETLMPENSNHDKSTLDVDADEVEDDEDGPVIIPSEEVEESLARSSKQALRIQRHRFSEQVSESNCPYNMEADQKHRQQYPLLFAATTPQEDLLMACARILEDANDVSLVREAAAYLEEVEARRRP